MRRFRLIKKEGQVRLRRCTNDEVRLMESVVDAPAYTALLQMLCSNSLDLRCPCGIQFTVVRPKLPYIRRCRDQKFKGESPCKLCLRLPLRESSGVRPKCSPVDAILAAPESEPLIPPPGDLPHVGTGGGDSGLYHPTSLGVLINLIHLARLGIWTKGRSPLARMALLEILCHVLSQYAVSAHIELSPTTSRMYYTVIPGLTKLAVVERRLQLDWPEKAGRREAWIIGLVSAVEQRGGDLVFTVSGLPESDVRPNGNGSNECGRPFTFRLKKRFVKRRGHNGPYLAIVACTLEDGVPIVTARLVARNAALHSIASTTHPVPVDSSHERDIVLWSIGETLGFLKPSVPIREVLPDEILLDLPFIIEIQGVKRRGYDEHKLKVHSRIIEAFPGSHLITYSPNKGETLDEFVAKFWCERRKLTNDEIAAWKRLMKSLRPK